MHQTLIDELRLALKTQADEATRQSSSRFFKEDQQVLIYGSPLPPICNRWLARQEQEK